MLEISPLMSWMGTISGMASIGTSDFRAMTGKKTYAESGRFRSCSWMPAFLFCRLSSRRTEDRLMVKEMFQPGDHIEIYVKCSLTECEKRDPKGLYKKARNGQISNFTGIDSKYDIPGNPDLIIDTERMTINHSLAFLWLPSVERNYLRRLLTFLVPLLAGRYRLFRGFSYACTPA